MCQNEAILKTKYGTLDDEERLVLDAWTVMQKSVLRSLDNNHFYHIIKLIKINKKRYNTL